jgi:hypothetical protein
MVEKLSRLLSKLLDMGARSTPFGQQTTEPVLDRAVRPGKQGGQTAPAHGRPKMLVPKRPEIGN